LLQQGVGLDGWPPRGTPVETASQLMRRLCEVTDNQLIPPAGSTFDRCLEELLFQQYGLSVRAAAAAAATPSPSSLPVCPLALSHEGRRPGLLLRLRLRLRLVCSSVRLAFLLGRPARAAG
jgi:hypothetical protein